MMDILYYYEILFSFSLELTIMDLAEIYLTVTSFTHFTTYLRKIDFKEFWEVRTLNVNYRFS